MIHDTRKDMHKRNRLVDLFPLQLLLTKGNNFLQQWEFQKRFSAIKAHIYGWCIYGVIP